MIGQLFAARIRLKPLAALCHRLATATGAGLEDRRIWRSEASRSAGAQQRKLTVVADQLDQGESLEMALRAAGNFFPPLFRQIAAVGELSGRLDRTYKQLARHYDQLVRVRRDFYGRLAWPMIQLGMAVLVVGMLIWAMGVLPINQGPDGPQVDILGLGLIGTPGLIVYFNVLIAIGLIGMGLIEASRRGVLWVKPLQRLVLNVPVIGGALKTLCLARFAWAAQLVFDTPMDLRRAVPLALEATGNDHYARHGDAVAEQIQQGMDLHTVLYQTGAFPGEMLDAIAVGEQSGMLAEVMRRQADEYQERSAAALGILAQVCGYAIWVAVAVLIIAMIFRLASFYVGTLQSVM